MSKSISHTEVLTREPCVSSTPPLILLQSEEEIANTPDIQEDITNTQDNHEASDPKILSTDPSPTAVSLTDASIAIPSQGTVSSQDQAPGVVNRSVTCSTSSVFNVPPLEDAWNLDHLLTEVCLKCLLKVLY